MRLRVLGLLLFGASCSRNEGVAPPGDQIFFPTGLSVDPGGRFLFVASSNYDIAFNGGTLATLDLARVDEAIASDPGAEIDEADFLVRGSAVKTGTFANDLVASGSRLFATIRGDNSVTWADVADDGTLVCSDSPEGSVPTCRGRFVLGREENARGLALPNEPQGLALHADGDRLFVTHADAGEVAMLETVSATPELTSVSDRFPGGSTGIAIRDGDSADPDDFLGYVTSRDSPVVSRFAVVGDEGVELDGSTQIEFLGAGGVDQRGIAFSPDYRQAYVVSRFPESLLVLDTASDDFGDPVDEFVDAVEVAPGPAIVSVAPDTGLVYVVCFRANKIFVIDPFVRLVGGILLTGEGPHTLVFDPTRQRAYLVMFGESTIWVIDVDPGSDTYHQRLLTIGIPDVPERS